MAVKTGKHGYVNGIPCVSSWGYNRVADIQPYMASCTDGGTGQTRGIINETGIITGLGGNPPITPGVEFTFKGVADNTPGGIEAYNGTIMPLSLSITADKENGGNLSWSCNFGVQGELTPDLIVGAADANYILHEGAAIIADAKMWDAGADYAIPGFRGWKLEISCAEKLFTINGVRHRKAGNLEATVGIDVYNSLVINPKYAVNLVDKVKLFVDATLFWNIEWVRIKEITGYNVDRASQALQAYTINADWTAVNTTLGHITRPGGVHLFGT
jgi:hypothetical protein